LVINYPPIVILNEWMESNTKNKITKKRISVSILYRYLNILLFESFIFVLVSVVILQINLKTEIVEAQSMKEE
jgi:hypothetical protein